MNAEADVSVQAIGQEERGGADSPVDVHVRRYRPRFDPAWRRCCKGRRIRLEVFHYRILESPQMRLEELRPFRALTLN